MAKKRGKNWQANAAKKEKLGSIKTQIVRNLTEQHNRGRGTSKHDDKVSGRGYAGKIYSDETCTTYINLNCRAVDWMKKEYGVSPHTILEFEKKMPAFLEHLKAEEYSAWTIKNHAAAAAKLYGGSINDFGVALPAKRSQDRVHNINSERGRASLLERERDLMEVVRLTGLRRSELEAFKRGNHQDFIQGKTDTIRLDGRRDNTKGARDRDVPLWHDGAERVRELLAHSIRMQKEHPFEKVDRHLPVHAARHDFAKLFYNRAMDEKRARGEETTRWYRCRDGSHLKYDKDVLKELSAALGHNRIDTSIVSYLR